MALVVITIQDEDDTVDIKAQFEPRLPADHMGDATPAQHVATSMVAAFAEAGEVTGAN